jgi:hypothetical protein
VRLGTPSSRSRFVTGTLTTDVGCGHGASTIIMAGDGLRPDRFLRLSARHGRPAGAARHVLASLAPDGTWLIVEPFASDDTVGNLNPVRRLFLTAGDRSATARSDH